MRLFSCFLTLILMLSITAVATVNEANDTVPQQLHWDASQFPLKLYVAKTLENQQPVKKTFVQSVHHARLQWQKVLGQKNAIIEVASSQDADIVITWHATIENNLQANVQASQGGHFIAGLTTPTLQDNRITRMKMDLALHDGFGYRLTPRQVYQTTLHEMGHVLGILSHSKHIGDVMNGHRHGRLYLSPRDVQTIRALYPTVSLPHLTKKSARKNIPR